MEVGLTFLRNHLISILGFLWGQVGHLLMTSLFALSGTKDENLRSVCPDSSTHPRPNTRYLKVNLCQVYSTKKSIKEILVGTRSLGAWM